LRAVLRRVEGFPLGVDARLDPFDAHPELAGRGFMFIYLTGRGESSYLFPPVPFGEVVRLAEGAVPMGYTQLWVLQWEAAVRPGRGRTIGPGRRRAAQAVAGTRARERAFVLLGERAGHVGTAATLPQAVSAARVLAVEQRARIALALLVVDVTWH
jgi:hypothetical protein